MSIHSDRPLPPCSRCGRSFDEGCTDDCIDAQIQARINNHECDQCTALIEAIEDNLLHLEKRAAMASVHKTLEAYADGINDSVERIRSVLANRVPDLTQQSLPLDESTRAA